MLTFVQGLIVGPTPKPVERSKSILFKRYDFPVLYIPATATMAISFFNEFKKSIASSLMTNSIKIMNLKFENLIKKSLKIERNDSFRKF